MTRPLIVDAFCCRGGAGAGYHRAGFDVLGIDIEPQPLYPFEFVQGDVLEVLERVVEERRPVAVHASPPCQAFTVYGNNAGHVRDDHPNLIPQTRALLERIGLPFVIENVPARKGTVDHLRDPVQVCGTGLEWCRVRRHRWFEVNWPLEGAPCDHGRYFLRFFPGSSNRPNGRTVLNVGEYRVPLRLQRKILKMPWSDLYGISQGVPPAMAEHVGRQLLAHVEAAA